MSFTLKKKNYWKQFANGSLIMFFIFSIVSENAQNKNLEIHVKFVLKNNIFQNKSFLFQIIKTY